MAEIFNILNNNKIAHHVDFNIDNVTCNDTELNDTYFTEDINQDLDKRNTYKDHMKRWLIYYLSEFELKGIEYNYVLLLQNNKIYVGNSDNVLERLTSHNLNSFITPQKIRDNAPLKRILYIKKGDLTIKNKIVKTLKEKFDESGIYC